MASTTRITSPTLHLPELAELVGQDVEILIRTRETPELKPFLDAAGSIDIDEQALRDLREASRL